MEPFDFTLPVSGKAIRWKPLGVGAQLDQAVAFTGQQSIYLTAALLASRVCKYVSEDGKESASCSLAQIKQWDEIDYNCFSEHVDQKERERRSAFGIKEDPRSLSIALQKTSAEVKDAMIDVMKKLDKAIEAAMAAEAAANAPLKRG